MYLYNSHLRPAQRLDDVADIAIRVAYDIAPPMAGSGFPDELAARVEIQLAALAPGESVTIDGVTVTRCKEDHP